MLIHLDRTSKQPLYVQVSSYMRRLIETDVLKPGVKLPATRELAADLGVDRATIVAAYDELVAQGFATAHVGQGTFVALHTPRGARPQAEGFAAAIPPGEALERGSRKG